MSALPRILLLAHRPAPPAVTSAPPAPPPAACSTRYLGAHVGVSQGAAGSTYVVLVFKNLNNYPCTLYGYPGVALDAGVPVTQVGLAAAEDPATPRERVTLGPYGTADALLRIGSDLGQHVVGRGKGSGHDLGRLGLRAGLQEAVRAVSVPVRKMATTV